MLADGDEMIAAYIAIWCVFALYCFAKLPRGRHPLSDALAYITWAAFWPLWVAVLVRALILEVIAKYQVGRGRDRAPM